MFRITAADPAHALHRRRREEAAALWRGVPPEKFDIGTYSSACGTTACALGWLAHEKHGGWAWVDGDPLWSGADSRSDPIDHAAAYFGLSLDRSMDCFGTMGHAHRDRLGEDIAITPAVVADTLLRLPYA